MIYFAYGADLNPSRIAAYAPGHRSLGVARLPNHKLAFPRFSQEWRGATAGVVPSPGDVVFGALYDLPADGVPVLHHHMGYDPEGPPELSEHLFRAVEVRRLATGEKVDAWTYVAVPDNTLALPSPRYLEAIIDGARYHGLPRAYIFGLQTTRTA